MTAEGMQTRKKNMQESNAEDSPPLASVVIKSGMFDLVESKVVIFWQMENGFDRNATFLAAAA